MKVVYACLLVAICAGFLGCGGGIAYNEKFRSSAMIAPEQERIRLQKQTKRVVMVVNVSPRMSQGGILDSQINDIVSDVKNVIQDHGIPVSEIIRTNNQQEIEDTSKGNLTQIGVLNISDAQMFEKHIPPDLQADAIFVMLFDACCPTVQNLADEEKYVGIAYALLVEGKRVDVWGAVLNLGTYKSDAKFAFLLSPVASIQAASDISASEYRGLLKRMGLNTHYVCENIFDNIESRR